MVKLLRENANDVFGPLRGPDRDIFEVFNWFTNVVVNRDPRIIELDDELKEAEVHEKWVAKWAEEKFDLIEINY